MDPLLILLFIVLFLLSGFFSGTEIALMSIQKHKIDSLVKSKVFWSSSLKDVKDNNDRLLIAILIGNNLVNVYTATLATQIAMTLAAKLQIPEAQIIWISTWIVTFFLLLFGEIIPKSFATKNATKISLLVAPIYKWLIILFFPVIIFIEFIIKIFSGKGTVEVLTNEEIQSFIDMGKEHGSLEEHEHEKIKSILEFWDTTVEEIMTPRVKIEAISSNTTVKEALLYYLEHTHSRIPVYNKTIDKIDYFLTSRDLIREYSAGNLEKKISDVKLMKVLKVPLNQTIGRLFETFQNSRKVLAIIIDEYGGVSGLVTLEDIIEEVFGEIRDESDNEVDELVKIGNDTFVVQSDYLMDELLEKLDLEFEYIWLDEKDYDGETISYFVMDQLDGFPTKNQSLRLLIKNENNDGDEKKILKIRVIEVENSTIGKVEVRIIKE